MKMLTYDINIKQEFNIGDIAHILKSHQVVGIINKGTDSENYVGMLLKVSELVTIYDVHKIREHEKTGGYLYDVIVRRKGVEYWVENIFQHKLMTKEMWEKEKERLQLIEALKR